MSDGNRDTNDALRRGATSVPATLTGIASASTGGGVPPSPAPPLKSAQQKALLEQNKLLWEQKKLQAETEEIRRRIKPPPKPGQWAALWAVIGQWLADILKYAVIIVPLVITAVAALSQWRDAGDQRERVARFTVGSEVTGLAVKLSNSGDQEGQKLAAFELAWFGRPAAFLLFQQLVAQDPGDVRDAIGSALAEVARAETGVPEILAQTTRAYVGATLDSDSPNITGISNRLLAIANVAAAIDSADSAVTGEYRATIAAIRQKVQAQPADRVTDTEKAVLLAIIDQRLLVSPGGANQ